MQGISIIIPVLNEAGNIKQLAERIHDVLTQQKISYEIIIVDDHSTDNTKNAIASMVEHYPIHYYVSSSKKGKASSLIEGFSHASYDLLCMIDGDLSYPPEAIPLLLEDIAKGSDVVVANRVVHHLSGAQKFFQKSYHILVESLMHGFSCDVQSGLKIFKKEIIERINLRATAWTFDLEFLTKARDAGYSITSRDINISKRQSGRDKFSPFGSSISLLLSALAIKFTRADIIPFHATMVKQKGQGYHYKGKEFVHHSQLHHSSHALHRLSGFQIFFLLDMLVVLACLFVINWHLTLTILVAVLTILYFADLLFNLFLIYRSFTKQPEIKISADEIAAVPENQWPLYTILCPLYKEWQVVPQFAKAISNLDYPKDKLQAMLLLEEDDKETIAKIRELHLPSYFEIVVVPDSKPKTKPKASNYGLQHAKGEYLVIYDAEDVPDPLQLKKAILAFEKAGPRTICIQAKLNFYNPHQNLLTRVFTAEYSLWFDLVLTGLQSIHAPIPLGGTSNHFHTKDLHKLKGWDSFNVTEDADLGMRLVKQGYRTSVIESITLEEANSSLKNWFGQRSRWIKGYIQTYFVHMRNPGEFAKNWKEPHYITFQLIVGGKVMSMFINPFMWVITVSYFVFRAQIGPFIDSFFPAPVLYMGITSLLLGNFLYSYYYMVGCVKHGHDELVKYIWLVPFYWLAMSIAAWMAFYRFIVAPHYWSKTKHGLHLDNSKAFAQAQPTSSGKVVTHVERTQL